MSKWSQILGYVIVILVMVAGFNYLEVARSNSAVDGRIVLCTGIVANTGNVARDDPNVVRICKEVGVDRSDYPETAVAP